jgi:nucleoside-diphosphate-sugar epimerase
MGRYLVTGAAGFIAARVCTQLLAEGHTVVGIDNLCDAYDVRLKEYRLRQLQNNPRFTFHYLDIYDRAGLFQTLLVPGGSSTPPFDAVFNLAARAGVRASVENPWIFVDTNTTGTLNLLEFSRQAGIPKFILASTSSLYGNNAPLPTPETASSDLPLQPYAASKKGAEAMCHAYHFLHGLDVTIFRYFTVYGPAGRPDMVMFRFTQWIKEGRPVRLYGDGTQTRGFTYVDDIASGTILGLKPVGYELINLGGHEVVSMNTMIAQLEALLGEKAKIEYGPAHPADMLANQADVSKACQLLGWAPRVGFEEGIRRLVEWYLSERSWAREVVTT